MSEDASTASSQPQQPPKSSTDEAVLLNLMQQEVDRSKASERSMAESAEMKERDEMRSVVMLRLAQEQIEHLKADNQRLITRTEGIQKDLESAKATMQKKDEAFTSLREDFDLHLKQTKEKESVAENSIQRTKQDRDNAQGSLTRLQSELEEAKAALAQSERKRETDSRLAFEEKVSLETKLKMKEEEHWFLEDLRAKETKTATSREYDLSQRINKLNSEVKLRRNEEDDFKRSTTATLTSFQTENEQLRMKLATVEGMTKASDRDNFEKIQKLTHELTTLRERAEQDQLAAAAREKALDTQIAKLVSDLRSAQSEVNNLAEKDAGNTQGHVNTIIQITAARDALKLRVESLEADNAQLRKDLHGQKVELGSYKEEMNKKLAQATRSHDAQISQRSDEISKLTYELTATSAKNIALQDDLDRLRRTSETERKTHTADNAALKAEVEGYKKSVEQLEKHISENYAQKALEEQNASLKAQNLQLKTQVSATNGALANLRVEADISEGYRIKLMQEEVELQLTRVNALEKERRFARPLIQDLCEVVQREDIADPALSRDIDMFFRQFGASAK